MVEKCTDQPEVLDMKSLVVGDHILLYKSKSHCLRITSKQSIQSSIQV
jgi:hypothetical protein